MSFIKKRFSLVTWSIKAEKFISEDMRVWPKKIIQVYNKVDGIITNCDSLLYYKVRYTVITNCDSFFYYKVWQGLLQIATGITKCYDYYELRQYT